MSEGKQTKPEIKQINNNELGVPINKDRNSLLKLYEQYQSLRQFETSKLRESGTFFQVIISALVLSSVGLGTNYNPLGIALSLFAVLFSIIGTFDIHRCYRHFLRWTSATYNVEELLQLHDSKMIILPEELKTNNNERRNKEIEKSGYKHWTKYFFGKVWTDKVFKDTLFQTYVRVFALFFYVSIFAFATDILRLFFHF